MSPSKTRDQAQRLYRVFSELVRGYQFRDREGICCHGISVSQCYTLDTLDRSGASTMTELAGGLVLELSSMTRVVDQLVKKNLVTRVRDPHDRRICRVKISAKGRRLVQTIRAELVDEHEMILKTIPAESRDAVITAISQLLRAFQQRQAFLSENACCDGKKAP